VQLLDAGACMGVVVLGALVVNARMLLYGAALAPYTAAWPGRWRRGILRQAGAVYQFRHIDLQHRLATRS